MTPNEPDRPAFEHELSPTLTHPLADPVAKPQPSPEGRKPIPRGEVEMFLVNADTGGGD